MRKYIVLLLITGIVWAQTDFDKLVLKNGTTYYGEYSKTEGEVVYFKPQDTFDKLILKDGTTFFGEYSKIEEEIVYFKPQDTFVFEPVSVKRIKNLQLKDGQIIIGPQNGIVWAQTDFVFEPVSVYQIKKLQLKDGRFIIGKYNRELATKSTGVNKLTRNEKVMVGCLLIAVVIYFIYKKGISYSTNDSPGLGCGLPCGQGTVDLP